jgi:uncharacterized protein YhaN
MLEIIYDEHEAIPLILDDAFVQYDDERFVNVMQVISKLKRQVIIFSCHEREYEFLKKQNIDFNFIVLDDEQDEIMEGEYVESIVY